MRKCLVCGEEKEVVLFVSSVKCKSCKREVDKKWEQENKEKIKERKRLRRLESPEKFSEKSKEYYNKNKETVLSKAKKRRTSDKKHLITGKIYYQKNRDEYLKKCLEYRTKKRESLGLPKAKVFTKNRFYIIEAGNFLGIGVTHDKSRRMYEHKRELSLIGLHFNPLFFFDCENDKLVRRVETIVKRNFCNVNLKITGFKTETCDKGFLTEIFNMAKTEFEKENAEFKIIYK